ncbi:alpha/beta hydrolase [Pseudofrankia inefficax]|uniref:Esterase n=1 Tax=Pseudofrankia inefficax (strain DSM 45817 / CECT 9037 / DDB 130130 / EuI1c) TaxID=298654 RepID=E3J3N4_PSEI1|nr:alpha/beta hydrolase-fold protein [Pseudofrankia inefficax]ADP79371.1 esterase [Pseudofrankia inefficax]
MGSLVVIGKWFILSLAGLAAAGWLGSILLRRRGRLAVIPVATLATLLTLATVADLVNAHYGYLPRVDDVVGHPSWPTARFHDATASPPTRVRAHPNGSVTSLAIPGVHSGFGAHRAMIYLPASYFTDPARRFPVVYLLHGTPGAPVDWYRANRAAQIGAHLAAAGQAAILVAPQVSRGWLDDSECVDRPSEHIETYLIDDVIPTVDQRLRTIPSRADRIFAGMSAGGFCALNLGLRHRDTVATIVDLSGFDRPTHTGGMVGLFGRQPDLARLAAANSPAVYAPSLPGAPPMRIWLDCGRDDHTALNDQRHIASLLTGRGYTVILRLRAGGHDYGVWRPALRDSLTWAIPTDRATTTASQLDHPPQGA